MRHPHRPRSSYRRGALLTATLLAAGALLAGCGGGDTPPASGAARLVPAGALVYMHLSTDPSRAAVQRANALANHLPGYPGLINSLVHRLSASGAPLDPRHDVRPWLGREAALALLNTGGRTASSLILLDISDRRKAQAFLARAGGTGIGSLYRGVGIIPYGSVQAAFVGHYLALGQLASLHKAIDLAAGRGRSLVSDPGYIRATAGLPVGRVLDGYLTVEGIRRLLGPRGGILGAVATLLDQPALQATGLALSAVDGGARLHVVSVLDPRQQRSSPSPFRAFSPSLASAVPGNALAYLGVAGLDRALGRLLSAAGGSPGLLGALVARVRGVLARGANASLGRQLAALFSGEVGLWIAPHLPAPTLAVVAHAPDESATRLALAQLQGPLAQLFAPPTRGGGVAPVFTQTRVAGVDAFSLRLTPAFELDYAVFDGKLVLSTSLDAIAQVRQHRTPLTSNPAFQQVAGDHPGEVSSLVFLDLGQLLRLGELTGLNQSRTYLAIRDDLQKVSAVGESSSPGQGKTTADLFFKIS
ncbi:MAG TPA: DUF3352 domain-containing protein [Solirubrobacteraceae bacterium]|nr:DUF3352 domain-containing protein [Solirubrobacteraceae bacterium]